MKPKQPYFLNIFHTDAGVRAEVFTSNTEAQQKKESLGEDHICIIPMFYPRPSNKEGVAKLLNDVLSEYFNLSNIKKL